MSILSVDRSKPRQYEDAEGKRYFSVSQVCAILSGDRYADDVAMQRGTDLHVIFALSIWAYAGKCQPPFVHSRYQGYYRSMQAWIERMKPEPLLVEESSVCSLTWLPFAGTPDLLAWIQYRGRRVLALVDLKSGHKAKWHAVQVLAYSKLVQYRTAQTVGILYIHEDGSLPIYESVKPNSRAWAAFTSALNLLIWREIT